MFPFKVTFRSGDGDYIGFSFIDHHPLQTGVCIFKTDKVEKPSHEAFNFYSDGYHHYLKENNVNVSDIHEGEGTKFFEFNDPDGNVLSAVTF